jgi:hypothetical protein
MARTLISCLGLAVWVAMAGQPGLAVAQDILMGQRYRQSPEVLATYPDIDVKIDTPALSAGRLTLTTQAEMESFLLMLTRPDTPIVLQTLAVTPQSRAIPILYFTKERHVAPEVIRTLGRPIVWLIGQQHGNEPAGGEAMLALAKELATGRLRPLLDRLSVVMVPRANPDGAALEQRDTAAKMDLNRDHATMALAETRALHAAVHALPPDLVIDAHEFSVAQRWIEKFGGLQAVDLMYLEATHPMVPEPITALAREVFAPAIEHAMAERGLKTFPYHTTSTRRADRTVSMGGNAPGIARNAFGLMGAVSFLLETRGVGIGMESYQRRVATHVVAIEAMLTAAANNAQALMAGVAAARRAIAEQPSRIVISATPSSDLVQLPIVDPATGERRAAEVAMFNSRKVQLSSSRERPAAYVLLPEARHVLAELKLFGAETCTVVSAADLDAEMFEINDRSTADRRAINPDAAVKATLREVRVHVPVGSVYVPMAQPMANRIASALEPDAPGSFVALDVVRVPLDRTTAPIVRVPAGAKMTLAAPHDASAAATTLCAKAL